MEDKAVNEFVLMKESVESFHWTALDKFRLFIDRLDTLALQVRGRNPQWDQEFRNAWGALEESYAVMVDRGMLMPDSTFQRIISSAVDKLKLILENKPSQTKH